MARPALLEDFDTRAPAPEPPPPEPAGPSADWLEGHAAGRAEAEAEAASRRDAAAAELAQVLEAMEFTFVEARAHVLASLRPLVSEMAEGLLPGLAEAARVPALIELVMAAAEEDARAPLRLTISPALHEALAPQLPLPAGPPLEVVADADLPDGRALLMTPEGRGTALDYADYLDELRQTLSALTHEPALRTEHG
ncbi:hypothetical protein [Pseudoroseicyclus tamaricis]|uniref:Flagellar assembly protein FliH n=1 Tax=Pseudoroseicyclus tamaricis TaxID=2705421 RepID=A0A6B2JVK0_9RHOB|nr:hypothetical protein [Pseudoroseicyclus tamaricis]NDV02527.1 hypothetical protein [Pseudoroseicyclus tamaricis]